MKKIMLFCCLIAAVSAYAADVSDILKQSDIVMHPPNLQGSFTMTLISRNETKRVIKVTAYQKKVSEEREDRLFLFTFPPSVDGTGLLVRSFLGSDETTMWMYLPAVKKMKRVNLSSSSGGYFMGSDFTYSDLISPGSREFTHTLIGDGEIDGEACYVIEVAGKTQNIQRKYGYSRTLFYIRKSDYVNVKMVFYDCAGDLLKELTVLKTHAMGPYRYPSHVIMENKQTGHSSEIVFEDLTAPDDIPDKYFTHRYLQHR
jgi:hypothetical protein